MEKLNSLPGVIILGLTGVHSILEEARAREDVPEDLRERIADVCEGLTGIIDHAREAQKELDPDYGWD
jgi:hypothetical protein